MVKVLKSIVVALGLWITLKMYVGTSSNMVVIHHHNIGLFDGTHVNFY